jgi:dTDP-4-amino-4,6-dideoxygalactose transaminase
MKIQFNNLYYFHKNLENKLINSFTRHLKKSDFISGTEVAKFENNFKKLNQSKYCVSCANGSDALVIAIKTLGIKPGDEVITTVFSWIATSAAVTAAGGKIVFCDVKDGQFNIDPKQIEKKITKKTVGIIPVHLYGYPADMIEIMKIARINKLWVIEDCAQAHLATINNKKVGNFGDFGTFSFFPGKNIGALGDAGCLVTKNKKLAKKARLIANHGGKGKHLIEGMNSRLDSIQASFLNIKIKYLLKDTKKRIHNANIYFRKFKKLNNIKLPITFKNFQNVYHQFVIKVKKRDALKTFLFKNGIETQIHYKKILPLMQAYKHLHLKYNNFPNAFKASKEILCLPIAPSLKHSNIEFIIYIINKFFNKKDKNVLLHD